MPIGILHQSGLTLQPYKAYVYEMGCAVCAYQINFVGQPADQELIASEKKISSQNHFGRNARMLW